MTVKRRPFIRTALGIATLLTALLVLAFLRATRREEAAITELKSIEELRVRFDADRGTIRLVLLLSPT
jgi:hypothetical protein